MTQNVRFETLERELRQCRDNLNTCQQGPTKRGPVSNLMDLLQVSRKAASSLEQNAAGSQDRKFKKIRKKQARTEVKEAQAIVKIQSDEMSALVAKLKALEEENTRLRERNERLQRTLLAEQQKGKKMLAYLTQQCNAWHLRQMEQKLEQDREQREARRRALKVLQEADAAEITPREQPNFPGFPKKKKNKRESEQEGFASQQASVSPTEE